MLITLQLQLSHKYGRGKRVTEREKSNCLFKLQTYVRQTNHSAVTSLTMMIEPTNRQTINVSMTDNTPFACQHVDCIIIVTAICVTSLQLCYIKVMAPSVKLRSYIIHICKWCYQESSRKDSAYNNISELSHLLKIFLGKQSGGSLHTISAFLNRGSSSSFSPVVMVPT